MTRASTAHSWTGEVPVNLRAPRMWLVPNHAMRARRCKAAIVTLWAWEAALGLLLSWPFAAVVRSAYGQHPEGDGVLWEPGGLTLLDLLVRRRPGLGPLFAHVATIIFFAFVLGLIPLAMSLASLAFSTHDRRAPSLRSAFQLAVFAMGPFVVLELLTLALQGGVAIASMAGADIVESGFERSMGEVRASLLAGSVLVLALAAAIILGILQDLARAAVIRFGFDSRQSLRKALAAFALEPARILWSWTWRALTSLVPIAFGALLAGAIGGKGGIALVVLLFIHQLAIGTRAALRVSFLARAMRLVDAHSQMTVAR
jgi:hypothetical protein